MKSTTRKHSWPVSLMTFAVIGLLAAFVVLAALPQATDAQGPENPFGGGSGGNGGGSGGNGGDGQSGPSNPFTPPDNMAPTVGNDITAQSVMAGETVAVQSTITDADGDALTWSASSDDTAVATATVDDAGTVTVTAVAVGSATITVTATDPHGLSATQDFAVTVTPANTAPTVGRDIADQMIVAGETVTVQSTITDADADDTLTYTAESDNTAVATVAVSGSAVTVTAVAAGSATITVTATDPHGLSATQDFAVTVAPANTAPTVGRDIADQMIVAGETVTVQSTITDADADDTLTYTAESDNTAVATATVDDTGMVTVTGVGAGTATITVTATDLGGDTATQDFDVTVPAQTIDEDDLASSSTSASASVMLTLDIAELPRDLTDGSSIVLYLEDDFGVPDDIDRDDVYFIVPDSRDQRTNNGGRVFATYGVEIDDDDHFGGDDDWDIQIFIPDFDTRDVDAAAGFQGPKRGESLRLVITKAAGITNPSEAHDSANTYENGYKWSYAVLEPGDSVPDAPTSINGVDLDDLFVHAKISLSDEDNDRGYELTVTGSGFNNGTSGAVHVLHNARYHMAEWWETLNCDRMKVAMGFEASDTSAEAAAFCFHYTLNTSAQTYSVADANKAASDAVQDRHLCSTVLREGARAGIATVGSDDTVAVAFEVTVPTFQAGDQNYICMVDGEGRASVSDVEQFELQDSLRIVPNAANAGDTVNVFAQDFPNPGAALTSLKIAGREVFSSNSDCAPNCLDVTSDSISADGSATATFELPGSISGNALEGTVRIDATWATSEKSVSEDNTITITGSALTLSKSEVSANESVTIRGSGFGNGAGCLVSATISGADLLLVSDDDIGNCDGIDVEVSSAGQFAATVAIWSESGTNPALTPGTHTIEVVDDEGFSGKATIVIKEPTLTVTPDVAGPRDYVTISGENWPVENEDGGNIDEVEIVIDESGVNDDEDADPDASGRWSLTYRVDGEVTIPSTVQLKATYGDGSEIVRVGSFSVPAANLTVDPMRAVPGDTITLSATGFSLFESDIEVKIGSLEVNVPATAHTDGDGAIDGLEVLVPSLDPALYTVQVSVGDTVTIGELTVMDDVPPGTPSLLPDALTDLGDNLGAVFYFNGATKSWQVFDPRPEWADLNTLDELNGGQAYWILVKETQDDVVLNGRLRNLTCSGDNCWNLEVW